MPEQPNKPRSNYPNLRDFMGRSGIKVRNRALESDGFETGVQGWRIDAEGNVEFNNGTFRGTFNIGGTQITVNDVSEVQDAIDQVEAAGGGTVWLQNTSATLTADIIIPDTVAFRGVSRDGVILDGDGTYGVRVTGSNVYTTGSIAINDGDTAVVGTGTTWTALMVGRYIFLRDAWYEITARTDNTHITIGSAYSGPNLSGQSYAIATVNFNATLGTFTLTNSPGVITSYAMEPNIQDLFIYDCAAGLDFDFVQFPRINVTAQDNEVNANFNFMAGFKIDFCEFSGATVGAGVVFTNSGGATFFDSESSGNTGNGVSLTDCFDIAFPDNAFSNNGGHGLELISGNSGIGIENKNDIHGNAGDGVKLTATSDQNIIATSRIRDNGGYGVNIAAATCDDNLILGNTGLPDNTTGDISDSGTGTLIRSNPGVTDN